MTKIIGGLVKLGIGKESSRGIGVTPTFGLPWVTFNFDDQVRKEMSKEAIGLIQDAHEVFNTERWGQGEIEGEIRENSFGLLLLAALGTVNSANVAGSVFDHTFTIANNNQHQSLSLTTEDTNATYRFVLAMINRLSLNVTPGEIVTFVTEFMSKKSKVDSSSVTIADENKFTAKHVTFKHASARAGLGAASVVEIQNLDFTINKNLLKKQGIGTIDPIDILNQVIEVSGSFTLPYDDLTYKNFMNQNTYRAVEIKMQNTDVDIGGGSNFTLTITLPRVGFFDWSPDRPKDSLYEQTINFRAFRDEANSEDSIFNIILRNTTTSY